MAESHTTYDSMGNVPQGVTGMNMSTGGHMRKFYTVNGNTNVTNEFTTKLKNKGQTEVTSTDQCDFILAFCLISTRAGIDIQETQDKCPDGKPVILVLLHHTYDPKRCEFRGPEIKNVESHILSVDLLFYDDHLLKCPHNETEFNKVLYGFGHLSLKDRILMWIRKSVQCLFPCCFPSIDTQ